MATFLFKGTVLKLDSWIRKSRSFIRWKHVDAVPRQSEESLSTPVQQELSFERHLGDTELSYYLPSRGDGVNDMWVFKSSAAGEILIHVQVSTVGMPDKFLSHRAEPHLSGLGNHETVPSITGINDPHAQL